MSSSDSNQQFENIDFSQVKINTKSSKEKFITSFHKWKNCFFFSFFLLISILLIIFSVKKRRKLNEQNEKSENFTSEIERLKQEVETFGKQVKELNVLINQLKVEDNGLNEFKTQLSENVKNLKKSVEETTNSIEYDKKEMEEMNVQLTTLNESIAKNEPLYASLQSIFLSLKRNFTSLGGKEEDIPTGEDDMTIQRSNIITTEEEINLLESWIGKKLGKACYKSSTSGLSILNFHKQCDNIKPTITIIKTDDNDILGGYTEQSWDGDNITKKDMKAFLFNLNKKKKLEIKWENNAITADEDYFVIFGKDFRVNYLGICYSGFPLDYGNSMSTHTDFSKTNKFLVIDLETYSIEN